MTEIRNLRLYRDAEPFDLTLYGGTVYGLTGFGADRLAEILGGVLPAGSGEIRVGGKELASARKRIGFVPDPPLFCEEMTPYEFLRMSARLRGADLRQMRLIPQLLETGDLTEVRDRAIRRLSFMQRKILSVLAAAAGAPELLVFVNPFGTLEEPMKDILFAVLDAVRGEATVLLTGEEKELSPLCGRMLRFRNGDLQTDHPKEKAGSVSWKLLVRGEREAILRALGKLSGISSCRFGMRSETGERFLDLVAEPDPGFEEALQSALAGEDCDLKELKREGEEPA